MSEENGGEKRALDGGEEEPLSKRVKVGEAAAEEVKEDVAAETAEARVVTAEVEGVTAEPGAVVETETGAEVTTEMAGAGPDAPPGAPPGPPPEGPPSVPEAYVGGGDKGRGFDSLSPTLQEMLNTGVPS
jgi:hypothetical protein